MRVCIDVEANALINPTQIWVIVCKDIDSGKIEIFRSPTDDEDSKRRFETYSRDVRLWVGHNLLGYDVPVLNKLIAFQIPDLASIVDTLVVSKLVDYSREHGHSLEAYGIEFGHEKGKNYYPDFFSKWSQELEDYCVRDVEISHRLYTKLLPILTSSDWAKAISLEQSFQLVVNSLHNNGFAFNSSKASKLLDKVIAELSILDTQILTAFPPREVLIREYTPRATKFGTISKTSVPRTLWTNIHELEVGKTYRHTRLEDFNPASHKQVITVLNEAGWKPTDKTKTHIETERLINQFKRNNSLDLEELSGKMVQLRLNGWKINEANLSTLPATAPSPARLLAKRILYESRRRTLTEWLGLVQAASQNEKHDRIHGDFYGIGAWTHRMAHQRPNTANIPNATRIDGSTALLGKELRSLWQAPRNRLLVGVDAEGIQLRIFAHYIDDKEFTEALVNGKKSNKTDPHSLNQRILGPACKSRDAAKRFVYALLLGAGIGKLTEILGCSKEEAIAALDRLLQRYTGFDYLKREVIPSDAKRGYFRGLDGRKVRIPGDTASERRHLCMSGYLQNGEAIIMKMATLRWINMLKDHNAKLVNFVHDEWQTECPNDMSVALAIASMQADSLIEVGEELKLKCPLAGSYYNDGVKDYTIGTNWSQTH